MCVVVRYFSSLLLEPEHRSQKSCRKIAISLTLFPDQGPTFLSYHYGGFARWWCSIRSAQSASNKTRTLSLTADEVTAFIEFQNAIDTLYESYGWPLHLFQGTIFTVHLITDVRPCITIIS